MQPSQEKIDFIKSQFPDRVLYLVEAVVVDKDTSEETVLTALMTAPTRQEYQFYTNKMIAAGDAKDDAERLWQTRAAIENAALAQIRWPERDEVKKVFDSRPEMIDKFAPKIQEAAGSNVEVRSKKL